MAPAEADLPVSSTTKKNSDPPAEPYDGASTTLCCGNHVPFAEWRASDDYVRFLRLAIYKKLTAIRVVQTKLLQLRRDQAKIGVLRF
jgi:hypothetical protein